MTPDERLAALRGQYPGWTIRVVPSVSATSVRQLDGWQRRASPDLAMTVYALDKAREWAQAHAEKCRAMPKPDGGQR